MGLRCGGLAARHGIAEPRCRRADRPGRGYRGFQAGSRRQRKIAPMNGSPRDIDPRRRLAPKPPQNPSLNKIANRAGYLDIGRSDTCAPWTCGDRHHIPRVVGVADRADRGKRGFARTGGNRIQALSKNHEGCLAGSSPRRAAFSFDRLPFAPRTKKRAPAQGRGASGKGGGPEGWKAAPQELENTQARKSGTRSLGIRSPGSHLAEGATRAVNESGG